MEEKRQLIQQCETLKKMLAEKDRELSFESAERTRLIKALVGSEQKFRTFFDETNDAILIIDEQGRFLEANRVACERFGYNREELLRMTPLDLDSPKYRHLAPRRLREVLEKGSSIFETAIVTRSGGIIPCEISSRIIKFEGQRALLSLIRDISDRKRAERRVRTVEERFRSIFESTADCVVVWDLDYNCLYANESAIRYIGLTRERVVGQNIHDSFGHLPSLLSLFKRRIDAVIECGEEIRGEDQTAREEGTVWSESAALPLINSRGTTYAVAVVYRDVTARKLVEDELKHTGERLQALSGSLIAELENERRHFARELHDEIGQALTLIKISLQQVQLAGRRKKDAEQVRQAIRDVEELIQRVRNLSHSLRPSVLDDLGLVPALRWYLGCLERIQGLSVSFDADQPEERYAVEVETAGFRIVQEAVTNAMRHSRGSSLAVELRRFPAALQLTVTDNGAGFDVGETLERAVKGTSLGLLGMRERVTLVGGNIDIESAPRRGTKVQVRLPLGGVP